MNLFELFVKIGVDDQASGALGQITSKLGSGLQTAAKIGTAAVTAAAAGITALTTAAVNNYAEYEQLVGGIETLFKWNANVVKGYAEEAYKTAGLSANEYMETVTSFSASLIQVLGSGTTAAAEYANQAIIDMADNANKMGTSMEMIQNAYQGFAKQNYTMLDNLKLGYGGTKTEMERLIADANAVKKANGEMATLTIESFADVVEAIHIIQTEMGITGTTAAEASETISGSVAAMKSAWSNLVTGIADDNADFQRLVDNFVDSVSVAAGNIIPIVEKSIEGAATLIEELLPTIMARVPQIILDILPQVANAAIGVVESLVNGLRDNQEQLVTAIIDTAQNLITSFVGMLPEFIELGANLMISLAQGIAQSLPELMITLVNVGNEIVNTLTSPEMLSRLLEAAFILMQGLAQGIMQALPVILQSAIDLVTNLASFLLSPENLMLIVETGIDFVFALIEGMIAAIPQLIGGVGELVSNIISSIFETDWLEVGIAIVEGIIEGVLSLGLSLIEAIGNLFGVESNRQKAQRRQTERDAYFQKYTPQTSTATSAATYSSPTSIEDYLARGVAWENIPIEYRLSKTTTRASASPTSNATINITTQIDGATLAHTTYNYNERESQLRGNSLVGVGS